VGRHMHRPREILFSTENMQSAMKRFGRFGNWNLLLMKNNHYLGLVSKPKIFYVFGKKLQKYMEQLRSS
jgi:CIC family chloride channel protein